MARGASRGTALMGAYNAGGWRAAGGMLGGAAAAGAWKGAAIGAGVGASMSLASDAWNGNYSGSVGRAFGAGLRGGVMGGGIGAVGGIGHSFFGAPRRLGTAMNRSAALRMPAPSRMSRAIASSRRVGPVGAARGMQAINIPAPAMSARGGMSMNMSMMGGRVVSGSPVRTGGKGMVGMMPNTDFLPNLQRGIVNRNTLYGAKIGSMRQ
jgi:hypothetical protein